MKKSIVTIALALCAFCVKAQNTVSEADKKFATDAAQAGMTEVKLGELAQANASSPGVKELGNHMISDHSKANDELKSLAATKSITLPTTLGDKGQKVYDELSKKQGAEFDKAYTKLMVEDHKKVIAEFQKESKSGSDPELKAWASKTLPTLEHHKQMSDDACKTAHNKK